MKIEDFKAWYKGFIAGAPSGVGGGLNLNKAQADLLAKVIAELETVGTVPVVPPVPSIPPYTKNDWIKDLEDKEKQRKEKGYDKWPFPYQGPFVPNSYPFGPEWMLQEYPSTTRKGAVGSSDINDAFTDLLLKSLFGPDSGNGTTGQTEH
jgi:hypothetical protein